MTTPEIRRGLQCSAERHLWRSGLTLAVYAKVCDLTWSRELQGFGTYHTSVDKMAAFLDCHYQAAYDAFRLLEKQGWFERVGDEKSPFKSKDYRAVSHKEWAKRHPGKCLVGEILTWDGEPHDRLGQALHKASFGKTRWYANMLAALRSTGKSDREILVEWNRYVEQMKPKPKRRKEWKSAQFRFIAEVKGGKPVVQSTD